MHTQNLTKVTSLMISLTLPLILMGLLLMGLPALANAHETVPIEMAQSETNAPLMQTTVGTTFTYQGRLLQGTEGVSGTCNLTFNLYNSPGSGTPLSTVIANGVTVQDGYFTHYLNFGSNVFGGEARWLEITINSCSSGGGSNVTLSPRVALQAAPYAQYALVAPWSGLSNVPPNLDSLGNLSCTANQIAQWNGTAWECVNQSNYSAGTGLVLSNTTFAISNTYRLPQTCSNGEVAKWDGTEWVCAVDSNTDTLATLPCSNGQVAKWNSTVWACAVDDGSTTSYSAGTGLALVDTTFSITGSYALPQSCGLDEIPAWDGAAWLCATDANTDTTYSAGDGLELTNTTFSVNFTGTGSLTTAARSDHTHPNNGWLLSGNNGTSTDHFVGTTDDMTLTLKVNDQTALRLIPGGSFGNDIPNVIGGAASNVMSDTVRGSVIGGGGSNKVADDATTVSGGVLNIATGYAATIGGGHTNQATAWYATVGGGRENNANGENATVSGGFMNNATGDEATISGGVLNNATARYTIVSGGAANNATADYATVSGGQANNAITGTHTTIGGGYVNQATANFATVSGGRNNDATANNATIGGGRGNDATASFATVGGGQYNKAITGTHTTVSGGYQNEATAEYATVGGGGSNEATGIAATVGGGYDNNATDSAATVGGGHDNNATGHRATVGGGYHNEATGSAATVGGGEGNKAITGTHTTVGGGYQNEASADRTTIPGGNQALASHYGEMAYASGQFSTKGDAQTSVYVLRRTSTNDTWIQLLLDGASKRITLPLSRTMTFDILITAAADNGEAASYQYVGGIKHTSSGTSLIGGGVEHLALEDDSSWVVGIGAQDHYLRIRVQGATDRTIHWVATVRTVETTMP